MQARHCKCPQLIQEYEERMLAEHGESRQERALTFLTKRRPKTRSSRLEKRKEKASLPPPQPPSPPATEARECVSASPPSSFIDDFNHFGLEVFEAMSIDQLDAMLRLTDEQLDELINIPTLELDIYMQSQS